MEIDRWVAELTRLHERIGGCFVRPEPRHRALRYVQGVLGPAVRKNGWQVAEQIGESTPTGVQRLLREAHWDAEAVTDELQHYIKQQFGARGGVMVVDETAFPKKGDHSAGVKRQYCGTTGQIENCQVGVFLYYVSAAGAGVFLDRALYLPEDWIADRTRCRAAAIPDTVSFQTKPEQARRMLQRAKDAGFRPAWTVGDAVYGSDPGLRAALEAWRWPYVLGIRSTEPVRLAADRGVSEQTAGAVAAALPAAAWQRLSAGPGTKGPRWFDWATVPLVARTARGQHTLLVRRGLSDPDDTALFLVYATRPTTLAERVTAAGWRWSIESGFEVAKGDVGLDHYEVRHMKCGNGTPGTDISLWSWSPTPSSP
jgi:SRSO17 transposase